MTSEDDKLSFTEFLRKEKFIKGTADADVDIEESVDKIDTSSFDKLLTKNKIYIIDTSTTDETINKKDTSDDKNTEVMVNEDNTPDSNESINHSIILLIIIILIVIILLFITLI